MSSMINAAGATIAENFGGVAQRAAPPGTQFELEETPDQSGKVAVITGGSEGIGYGVSHTLLSKNISKLFIISMNKEVVDGAMDAVKEEMGEEIAKRTTWIHCDISDWKRVAEVAQEISNSTDRLDILINNASRGIMTYQLTDYGVDRHMAVNHMGHVILTSHLLPLMKKTAQGGDKVRIVNQASNAHVGSPSDTRFTSLEDLNQDLGPNGNYGRSKLAAILYTRYLARHLTSQHPNILATATHPGFVHTKQSTEDILEAFPLAGYGMRTLMAPFKKDQFEGCKSTVFAATMVEKSGQYVCPPAIPEEGSAMSQDEQLGEDLMKLTRELVTEKTKVASVDKGCPMQDY